MGANVGRHEVQPEYETLEMNPPERRMGSIRRGRRCRPVRSPEKPDLCLPSLPNPWAPGDPFRRHHRAWYQ